MFINKTASYLNTQGYDRHVAALVASAVVVWNDGEVVNLGGQPFYPPFPLLPFADVKKALQKPENEEEEMRRLVSPLLHRQRQIYTREHARTHTLSLTHSATHKFFHSQILPLTNSATLTLCHSRTLPLTHSATHALCHSHILPQTECHLHILSLTHSFSSIYAHAQSCSNITDRMKI